MKNNVLFPYAYEIKWLLMYEMLHLHCTAQWITQLWYMFGKTSVTIQGSEYFLEKQTSLFRLLHFRHYRFFPLL